MADHLPVLVTIDNVEAIAIADAGLFASRVRCITQIGMLCV